MRKLTLALIFIACSCTSARNDSNAAPAPAVPPASDSAAATAPVQLHWEIVSEEPGRAVLTAKLDRRIAFAAEVQLAVEVPDGVTLAHGPRTWTVPAGTAPGTSQQDYEVQFTGTPTQDLVVSARCVTPGFSFQSRDAYRFGRPAPVAQTPQAKGPVIQLGNMKLGPSVPVQLTPASKP